MTQRFRTLLAALALLFSMVGGAAAQQRASLDPELRALMRPDVRSEFERRLRVVPEGVDTPLAAAGIRTDLAIAPVSGGEPEVGVFLRLSDDAGLAALRAAGASIRAVEGHLVAARVPLSALGSLARSGHVLRMEAAHRVTVQDDSSTLAMNAEHVREVVEGNGNWVGFTGSGVIVGTYDTGVDFQHKDFVDPQGKTRLVGLWDQTLSGTPPAGFTFGDYCDPASLQASIDGSAGCPEIDRNGHGTHTAGIAAGDGSASATGPSTYRYAGVAPEASLLVVKGGDNSFYEDNIIAGLQWIKQRAQALGKPAVANLSIGSQFGPHDGSRLYEQMIDSLSAPGFMVVVAAGNDGANPNASPPANPPLIHAQGTPVAGTTEQYIVDIPAHVASSNTCNDYALVDLWYNAGDHLTVGVHRPDGTAVTVAAGDTVESPSPDGNIYIDNASQGPDPDNGENEAYIELSGCAGSGSPQAGNWTLDITPQAPASGQKYDMWLMASALGSTAVVARGGSGFDNRSTVSSPGTARRAITVGAFTTNNCIPSSGGTACDVTTDPVGDITFYSGTGPTRDGRLKPEITAPGRWIVSALSANASIFQQVEIAPDQRHAALQGTSMATPAVTGATALLLEFDPTLTPEQAKADYARSDRQDSFTAHSYVDGDPGGVPNQTWGYGKLDVQAALTALGAAKNAATLAVAASDLTPPQGTSSSKQGTLIPLLDVSLSAAGAEPVAVRQLGFALNGQDPAASVVLVRDLNGNGQIDSGEPTMGRKAATADVDTVLVTPDSLLVPANGAISLIAALDMSGQAPNGTHFTLDYLPGRLRSAGVVSHVAWLLDQPATAVASQQVRTSVLSSGEVFAMSENPIRSAQVIFNFDKTPDLAAIYTLSGRRVVDLKTLIAGGLRAAWDVTNGDGARVAPGIYLLVVEVDGQRITRKLFITGENTAGSQD